MKLSLVPKHRKRQSRYLQLLLKGVAHYSNTGGMSVSLSPDVLPTHRKPPELGGTGKNQVWAINTNDLGPDLTYVPDSPGHGTIQPTKPMTLEDYQKALAETNINWEKVECH